MYKGTCPLHSHPCYLNWISLFALYAFRKHFEQTASTLVQQQAGSLKELETQEGFRGFVFFHFRNDFDYFFLQSCKIETS